MADNDTLKSLYLSKVEADLERNTKEKECVATDLTALQEQLAVLEQDHTLLLGVRQTLLGEASSLVGGTESAHLPAAAQSATLPKARTSKVSPRVPKPATGKKAGATTATDKGSSPETTSLRALVLADVTANSEPRSAAEVTASLVQAHPDRKIQTAVVRNTLEYLVAKGHTLRTKQNRSVYYTAAQAAPAAGESETAAAA